MLSDSNYQNIRGFAVCSVLSLELGMFRHYRSSLAIAFAILLLSAMVTQAQDNWTRFRGADATGVAQDDPRYPEEWDKEKNIQWVADIPGWGWGSPIVWRDKVFVSAVHSDDDYEKPKGGLYLGGGRGEPPNTVHHWMVYCLDIKSGKVIWKQEAHAGKPVVGRHPKSTYAAETPATDGERLYVLFGDLGLYCYDLDGKPLWKHLIDPKETMQDYGAAASPVVHGDQVIYTYDNQEESYIAALDSKTGETRWRVDRDEKSTWGTPFVWEHSGGTEIVQTGKNENRAYSTTGDLLWHFNGKMSVLTIPSPFVVGDTLYITSGYFQDPKRPVFAIKPGARGDITLEKGETSNEFIKWSLEKMGPYNTTPIVYMNRYYTLLDRGMLTCHDATTGGIIFDRVRFPRGASFTASPWAYNGKVFFLSEDGRTFAITPGKELTERDGKKRMVVDTINDLDELSIATPSTAQGKLLLRTASKVYCISQTN